MKQFIIILLTVHIATITQAQSDKEVQKSLYRIVDNNLWGYINTNGEIVIEPQFSQASYFINGLAMVAKEGRFGFINTSGALDIPTKYDIGSRFFNGIARMYLNGKPYFINTKGDILFEHDFKEISFFTDNGYAIVTTKDHKRGLIDRKGEIIIEPIYQTLEYFEDEGVLLVEKTRRTYGVLDLKGNIVVPFDTYDRIDAFVNGLAYVEYTTDEETDINDYDGFIDSTGKIVLKTKNQPWKFDYDKKYFHEDLGIVQFFKKNPDSITDWRERRKNKYLGFIDTKGNIIKKDTSWTKISDFSKERAFVQNRRSNRFRMIDAEGNYVSKYEFDSFAPSFNDDISKNFFDNDEIYVFVNDTWGMINKNGEFTIPLTNILGESDYEGYQQIGDYLVYYNSNEEGYVYGMCNLKTNLVIPAKYTNINFDTLQDDLIHVEENGKLTYIDQKGNIIWEEKIIESDGLKSVNLLAMNRGYFRASSPSVKELEGFGGWADSDHEFQKIKKKQKLPKNTLGISVDTETIVPHYKEYKGYNLYVYNSTKDSIFFEAQDSRLYMNVQAKNEHGEWKDIEYLPSSWCGNSYHTLFLAKNSFWEFTMPKYEGTLKTTLRVKLLYKTDHKDKENKILYSNEFQGGVNPAQFWYKGSYTPSGIMDPYNE